MKVTVITIIAGLAFGGAILAQELAGIGVDLTRKTNEPVKFYRIHPGSPAEQAGIKPGGFLIAIDGTNAMSMPLSQAAKMVRGRLEHTLRFNSPTRT